MNKEDTDPGTMPRRLRPHRGLVGGLTLRPDAVAKLAGAAPYLTDRHADGMLHARVLRSPHAHAEIVALDVSAAAAMPGVRAVITAADVPGRNAFGLRKIDQPVLCTSKVRFIGDPVAAVAADTPEIAQAALARIVVRYAPLPVIDSPERALDRSAVPIHDDGNLLHEMHHAHGDLPAAWAGCTHIVEDVYDTGRQMHGFLETEGGIVEPETLPDGSLGLAVYVGSQHPQRDRQALADILALPAARIRVTASPVGGSFGGKDELTVQPIAALLALKTGRPVRLHLSRAESTLVGVKRHPFRIRMRTGCDSQGRLLAHEAELLADTGAYATHGPEVLDAAHEHAQGAYRFDAVAISSRVVYTNNGVAGAFRGFGAVQVQFAMERQIDRLARAAAIDPIRFRLQNLAPPDGPGPLGQVVVPSNAPAQVLSVLARHPLPQPPHADARYRFGSGVALVSRSDGFSHGGPNGGKLELALAPDGRIEVHAGFTEMGQGILAAMTELAASHLQCAADEVRPMIGHSDAPDAGPTSASRATSLLHKALRQMARTWQARLLQTAGEVTGRPVRNAVPGPRGLRHAEDGRLLISYADMAAAVGPDRLPRIAAEIEEDPNASRIEAAHHVFGTCAATARVRVDTWTGAVRTEELRIVAGLGPVVSPAGFLGQMEGGAVMGQGMALLEELAAPEGRYAALNFDRYFMPTLCDAPRMEVIAVEDLMPGDTVGPRGAGEISVNVAVPAIANAVADALDVPVTRLPIKPEDVLAMLDDKEAHD